MAIMPLKQDKCLSQVGEMDRGRVDKLLVIKRDEEQE